MSRVILRKGRATPVIRRHPWVFSGAIDRIEGHPPDGEIVEVFDAGHNWLARGYINRQSQITVRLLSWHESEVIDRPFWRRRLERAISARRALSDESSTTAYRLVHGESDYLPGLIVDRYGDWLVVQFLTLGMDRRRREIVDLFTELLTLRGIYERSDVDVRQKEGLEKRTGVLWGDEPPNQVEVLENGHRFLADLRSGHKTGFYLDQRENRTRLRRSLQSLARPVEMLDLFSYSGAFSAYAAASGVSSITLVDSSSDALELARQNLALETLDPAGQTETSPPGDERQPSQIGDLHIDYEEADVFSLLRAYRAEGRSFDVIVLDPPKFAQTKSDVRSASRAYKDINLLAFQILRPGGMLFTFSCSGRVSADLFQKIVFGALADTDREAQIIGHLSQSADHPVALTFPEGAYLKGLMCRVW